VIVEILTILCIALLVIPFIAVLIGGPILLVRWTYEAFRDGEITIGLFTGGALSFVLGLIGLTILTIFRLI